MSRTSSASASSRRVRARDGGRAAARAAGCRPVAGADELAEHFRVRRSVFVEAQGLFAEDDRDERDAAADTIHVVAVVDGAVLGAVRLYPLAAPGLWRGDRLAVVPSARSLWIGGDLVRCAVRLAAEAGGETMVASVQLPNVRFFERLGWHVAGAPETLHGVLHQPMEIPLRDPSVSPPPSAG